MRNDWIARCVLVCASMVCAGSAWGQSTDDRESRAHEITQAQWREAVLISGIPSELLFGLTMVESGTTLKRRRAYAPWPWVLNISGNAVWFASRQEARARLAEELSKNNLNVAVGMFQISLAWKDTNGADVDDALSLLDPKVSLMAAARVLRQCRKRYAETMAALACYNSGENDERGRRYAKRVVAMAQKHGSAFRQIVAPETPIKQMTASAADKRVVDRDYQLFLARISHDRGASSMKTGGQRAIRIGGTP